GGRGERVGRDVVVEAPPRREVAEGAADAAPGGEELGQRVEPPAVVAGPMGGDRREDRGDDVVLAAVLREVDLEAGAGGSKRLDEEETGILGDDHLPPGAPPPPWSAPPPLFSP